MNAKLPEHNDGPLIKDRCVANFKSVAVPHPVLQNLITDHFSYNNGIIKPGHRTLFSESDKDLFEHFFDSFDISLESLSDFELAKMIAVGKSSIFFCFAKALLHPDTYDSHKDECINDNIYAAYLFVNYTAQFIPAHLVRRENALSVEGPILELFEIASLYAEGDFKGHKETDLKKLCHLQRLIQFFPFILNQLEKRQSPNLHRIGEALMSKLKQADVYLKSDMQKRHADAARKATAQLAEIGYKIA